MQQTCPLSEANPQKAPKKNFKGATIAIRSRNTQEIEGIRRVRVYGKMQLSSVSNESSLFQLKVDFTHIYFFLFVEWLTHNAECFFVIFQKSKVNSKTIKVNKTFIMI